STNAALNGSVVVDDSGSGHWPFTRTRSSERKRVSREKSPCGAPGNMSPDGNEIANAVPSTRVTTSRSAPPRAAPPLPAHGMDTTAHASPHFRASHSYARTREDRGDRSAVVHRPALGIRRDRTGRRVAHRRARRTRPRRHALRERRIADEGAVGDAADRP